jgi:hypothetical protein
MRLGFFCSHLVLASVVLGFLVVPQRRIHVCEQLPTDHSLFGDDEAIEIAVGQGIFGDELDIGPIIHIHDVAMPNALEIDAN